MYMVALLLPIMTIVYAANELSEPYKSNPAISCSATSKCPPEWPCCSQYGLCGSGPLCIGGCNPKFSFNVHSCVAMPALLPPVQASYGKQNKQTIQSVQILDDKPTLVTDFRPRGFSLMEGEKVTEADLNSRGLMHFSKYLITPDKSIGKQMLENYEFTYSGYMDLDSKSNDIILGMPNRTTGSLISSTRSFLYGKAAVTMKTARSRGVISAVMLFSAVRDEIDFEFLGSELTEAQTNYYHQGELVHTRMQRFPIPSDSFQNYHTYELDWNEERIHWLIDGVVVRTLFKRDTWDPELKIFKYPQTPMKLEVSLWPGGMEGNDPGTISWAGGLIDWENSPDIIEKKQFYSMVKQVTITPYPNKHWPSIMEDLNKGNLKIDDKTIRGITYGYEPVNENYDEDSLVWYHGITPQLASWDANGLNSGIEPSTRRKDQSKTQVKKVPKERASQELVQVDQSTDFIQDIRRLHESEDGALLYNTTGGVAQYGASRQESKAAQNDVLNPVKRLRMLFF